MTIDEAKKLVAILNEMDSYNNPGGPTRKAVAQWLQEDFPEFNWEFECADNEFIVGDK